MLSAARRIRTAAEFLQVTRRGARSARGSIIVYADHGGSGPARLGVITSSQIGGSVIRHRAARRIRGAMRPAIEALPNGVRVVVRAQRGAHSDPDLASSLTACLSDALERSEPRPGR